MHSKFKLNKNTLFKANPTVFLIGHRTLINFGRILNTNEFKILLFAYILRLNFNLLWNGTHSWLDRYITATFVKLLKASRLIEVLSGESTENTSLAFKH